MTKDGTGERQRLSARCRDGAHGVAQRVRRDAFQPGCLDDLWPHLLGALEEALATVSGEDEVRVLVALDRLQQLDRSSGQRSNRPFGLAVRQHEQAAFEIDLIPPEFGDLLTRSEAPTSELQSLLRISYAVFCLKKKKNNNIQQ